MSNSDLINRAIEAAKYRQLRIEAGLSAREMASRLGINVSYIYTIESGVRILKSEWKDAYIRLSSELKRSKELEVEIIRYSILSREYLNLKADHNSLKAKYDKLVLRVNDNKNRIIKNDSSDERKALTYILLKCIENEDRFFKSGSSKSINHVGSWDYNTDWNVIGVSGNVLRGWLKKLGYNKSIINKWNDRGWLKSDKNKNTTKMAMGESRPRLICIRRSAFDEINED